MTVAGCDNGTYDGMLAIYETEFCECPPDWWYVCDDEGCDPPSHMPSIEDLGLWGYGCYLIRVGGFLGNQGSGELHIHLVWDYRGPPLPEDCSTIAPGNRCNEGGTCTSDEDCRGESICVLPPPELWDSMDPVCYAPKTRYISIARVPFAVASMASRLKRSSGELLGWVGEPIWNAAAGMCTAQVQAAPYYTDTWCCAAAPDEPVHVYGCEIAPNNIYDVQAIRLGEDIGNENNYSEPLQLPTVSTWGDTTSYGPGGLRYPANGYAGLADIMAAIAYFQGDTAIAPLTWLDIAPSTGDDSADQVVGLGDIMGAIAGFQGDGYPGDGPLGCP